MNQRQSLRSIKLRGDVNQCPGCNLYFNSNSAFDKHRTGPHSSRRCLTEDEMSAKGMILNYRDLWCCEAMPEDYKQRKKDGKQRNPTSMGLRS